MYILRTAQDNNNPTLAGGVYGKYITLGKPIYFNYSATDTRTRFIIFIADGGRYGLDKIDSIEYKGGALPATDFIFHRGKLCKQVVAKPITLNVSTNTFTSPAHGYADGTAVRLRVAGGVLPNSITKQAKYYIASATTNTFKVSLTSGGAAISLTDAGSGNLIVWEANAGFDDSEQGLPTICPETNSTFSGISYIEGMLTAAQSTAATQPDWQDFRILGTGRRLMSYSNTGTPLGIIANNDFQLENIANQIADNLLDSQQIQIGRIDWQSLNELRLSNDVLIWQRAKRDSSGEVVTTAVDTGLSAKYYNIPQTPLPPDLATLIPVVAKTDNLIDFTYDGFTVPTTGVDATYFAAVWEADLLPKFTELYTFSLIVADGARLYVGTELVIDGWTNAAERTLTGTVQLTAEQYKTIRLEYFNSTAAGRISLKWQSASQALEVIPQTRFKALDEKVARYQNSMAFGTPTEATEVHERFMDRCVGWDWTEDDGLIKFLPPNRPLVYTFEFDALEDDTKGNFVKKTFVKKRRALRERPNFKLYRFRNRALVGYPFSYTEGDRQDLRRFTGGVPTNDPATDLGVMTRSLAERYAENKMVMESDPKHTYSISGDRSSGILRKNHRVLIKYYDTDGNFVANQEGIISFRSWGAKNGRNDFTVLPLNFPFYMDEPV